MLENLYSEFLKTMGSTRNTNLSCGTTMCRTAFVLVIYTVRYTLIVSCPQITLEDISGGLYNAFSIKNKFLYMSDEITAPAEVVTPEVDSTANVDGQAPVAPKPEGEVVEGEVAPTEVTPAQADEPAPAGDSQE